MLDKDSAPDCTTIVDLFIGERPTVSPSVVELTHRASAPLPIDQLESIVKVDAELSLRVLSLANSAFYSRQQKVESLRAGLIMLGDRIVYRLAATALSYGLMGPPATDDRCWRRSLTIAVAARKVAEMHRMVTPDVAFATGLLHQIGAIAIARHGGDVTPLAPKLAPATISAAIAARVGLPETMVNALSDQANVPNLASASPLSQSIGLGFAITVNVENSDSESPAPLSEWATTIDSLQLAVSDLTTLQQELNVIVDAELRKPELSE